MFIFLVSLFLFDAFASTSLVFATKYTAGGAEVLYVLQDQGDLSCLSNPEVSHVANFKFPPRKYSISCVKPEWYSSNIIDFHNKEKKFPHRIASYYYRTDIDLWDDEISSIRTLQLLLNKENFEAMGVGSSASLEGVTRSDLSQADVTDLLELCLSKNHIEILVPDNFGLQTFAVEEGIKDFFSPGIGDLIVKRIKECAGRKTMLSFLINFFKNAKEESWDLKLYEKAINLFDNRYTRAKAFFGERFALSLTIRHSKPFRKAVFCYLAIPTIVCLMILSFWQKK